MPVALHRHGRDRNEGGQLVAGVGAVRGGGTGDLGRRAEAFLLPGNTAIDRPAQDPGQLGVELLGQGVVLSSWGIVTAKGTSRTRRQIARSVPRITGR